MVRACSSLGHVSPSSTSVWFKFRLSELVLTSSGDLGVPTP
ncbi:hypothetical protein Hdeb2414_s0388g00883201 [Helianthus debilis subsp. tardiflorus]